MIDAQHKGEQARDLYFSGYNCAQAVAGAFAEEMDMPFEQVVRLAGGLGGGLGGLREVCGSVSGMCLAFSAIHGYEDPEDQAAKKHLYALEQRMAALFTERFETLNCRRLLDKAGIEAQSTPSPRTPEYYRTRPCHKYVQACAEILAEELNQLS